MFLLLLLACCTTTTFGYMVTYDVTAPEGSLGVFNNDNYMNINWTQIQAESRQIKIICDGWQGIYRWYSYITAEYMLKGDTIVIGAYYKEAVSDPLYFRAVMNTTILGETIGKLIVSLHEKYEIPLKNFHIIGHSIGAEIGGVACTYVKNKTGSRIYRATGLDTAAPLYYPFNVKLHKDVAEYVDVYHSSILGIQACIGDSCINMNGGFHQPGCESAKNIVLCEHAMPVIIFTLSIKKEEFIARKCFNYFLYRFFSWFCFGGTAKVGNPMQSTDTGKLFLTTKSYLTEYQQMFDDNIHLSFIPSLD